MEDDEKYYLFTTDITERKTPLRQTTVITLKKKTKKSVELKTLSMETILQVKTTIQMPNTDHMMHVKCLVNLYIWLRVHLNPYVYIYLFCQGNRNGPMRLPYSRLGSPQGKTMKA